MLIFRSLGIFGILAWFSLPLYSYADRYDWRKIDRQDFRVISSPQVEAEFRLDLIRNAQKTIDVAIFDQRKDLEIGDPTIEALRFAADHGVRVRFIRGSYLTQLYGSFSWWNPLSMRDAVGLQLTSPPTQNPIQYAFFGGYKFLLNGWNLTVGAHEKLLIIDGRIVVMTGRGYSKIYQNFLDGCIVFKSEPQDGPKTIVHDAQEAFENLWVTIHQETGKEVPATKKLKYDHLENSQFISKLSGTDFSEVTQLKEWAATRAKAPDDAQEGHSIPIRFLHHNLIQKLRENCDGTPWVYNFRSCSQQFPDPILKEMVRLVRMAEKIQFYTLAVVLHPDLKAALLARLEEKLKGGRNFELEIFTNQMAGFKHFVAVIYPLAWKSALTDMNDLLKKGAKIFALTQKAPDGFVFLHKKGLIVDQKVILKGSHNSNSPSSDFMDEMDIEMIDSSIGQQMSQAFDDEVKKYGVQLDPKTIYNEAWWNSLPVWGWESHPWRWALSLTRAFL